MTDQDWTPEGDDVLTLQQLVRARMDERGWTYPDLAHRSKGRLKESRLQQIGSGVRIKEFPEPATIQAIADVLEVDITTVVLAAAQSVGLDARRRGPDLAHLLPAGTDRLSDHMRDAILSLIRAAVAETLARTEDDVDAEDTVAGGTYQTVEVPPFPGVARRNAGRRSAER